MAYYESRLRLNCKDFDDIRKKFRICEELGIKNLIIEPINQLKLDIETKNKISKFTSINLNFRINFQPKNISECKSQLNSIENPLDIISVETSNKEIQIQIAKDSRVDIITFSDIKMMKTLTPGVISLTKQNNSFIEISLVKIMEENRTLQSKNFREIYRIIDLIRSSKGNLIISGNFYDSFHYRHPRALISICHTLFGIPIVEAKKYFKDNVELMLDRTKNRKNKDYVEDGVLILRGDN